MGGSQSTISGSNRTIFNYFEFNRSKNNEMNYVLSSGYTRGDEKRMRRHVSTFFRFTYRMNFESFKALPSTSESESESENNSNSTTTRSISPTTPNTPSSATVSSATVGGASSSSSISSSKSSSSGFASGGGGSATTINRLASSLGSDAGWGCMLRAAQMLMGHVLVRHCLGVDWRFDADAPREASSSPLHREILRLFMDYYHESNKFSIHHMIATGFSNPGEWCGPVKASYILKDICKQNKDSANSSPSSPSPSFESSRIGSNIEVFVSSGSTIYYSEVASHMIAANRAASDNDEKAISVLSAESTFDPLMNTPPLAAPKEWDNSLLLFIPLRLGINSVDPVYHKEIQKALRHPNCAGMLGGKVNHAMYFIGFNSNRQYLGLDPHVVYSTAIIDENFPSPELLAQVHVHECELLDEGLLDPSISLAYYFTNRAEFDEFYKTSSPSTNSSVEIEGLGDEPTSVKKRQSKSVERGERVLFTIEKFSPNFSYGDDLEGTDDDLARRDSDDEYVFI